MIKANTSSSSHDREGLTLQEISNIMDLTKERVRQIEVRALMKLKCNLTAKKSTPADLFGGML